MFFYFSLDFFSIPVYVIRERGKLYSLNITCPGAHLKQYISANAPETDQVKRTFAASKVKCIRWDCVHTQLIGRSLV